MILDKKEIDKIKKAIPDYQCFVVGSRTIKNVDSGDTDILVLVDKGITIEEVKRIRKKFRAICPKPEYSLLFNWAEDNKKIKETFPYYDLKTDDFKYADKDKMTIEEYEILKNRLGMSRLKTRRFYKERHQYG